MDCPNYHDDSAVRCGMPTEVLDRYVMESSDGPLEGVRIRCVLGHWFNGPVQDLIIPKTSPDIWPSV